MNYLVLSSGSLFGLDIFEVLLHMLNLLILVAGFTFLLYKPIKKIMDARREEYARAEEEKNNMLKDAEEFKANREAMVKGAKAEEKKILDEAREIAEAEKAEIIGNAKAEARAIYEKAVRDTQAQKARMKEELADTVPDLAIKVASEVLRREINAEDHSEIIKTIIEEWQE